jgi:hypothetical protein
MQERNSLAAIPRRSHVITISFFGQIAAGHTQAARTRSVLKQATGQAAAEQDVGPASEHAVHYKIKRQI